MVEDLNLDRQGGRPNSTHLRGLQHLTHKTNIIWSTFGESITQAKNNTPFMIVAMLYMLEYRIYLNKIQ